MFSKKGSIIGKGVFGFFEKWVNFWGVNFWHPTVIDKRLKLPGNVKQERTVELSSTIVNNAH